MAMGVDAAGQHHQAAGIDILVGSRQIAADRQDALASNTDIGPETLRGRDHSPIANTGVELHGVFTHKCSEVSGLWVVKRGASRNRRFVSSACG